MSIRKMIIGLFVCLSVTVFASQTLSQTRIAGRTRETPDWILRKDMTSEQINIEQQKRSRQQQMQNKKRIEQLRKQSRIESAKRTDESMREALRATEQKWKVIKPRLDKVKYLTKQAQVSMTPASYRRSRGSGGSSNNRQPVPNVEEGWKWSKAWEKKAPGELTEGERICEELLELLEDKGSKQEEIEQKVEALREARKETGKQLAKAQEELREVLTFRQEATLVLMRYLD
ncbi:MAG: hypothetical protein ACYS6K_13740 [Planctomycetota bacterium]|jgi:Spy/CpxP family protein refolding chaperone